MNKLFQLTISDDNASGIAKKALKWMEQLPEMKDVFAWNQIDWDEDGISMLNKYTLGQGKMTNLQVIGLALSKGWVDF